MQNSIWTQHLEQLPAFRRVVVPVLWAIWGAVLAGIAVHRVCPELLNPEHWPQIREFLLRWLAATGVMAVAMTVVTVSIFGLRPDLQTDDGLRQIIHWMVWEWAVAIVVGLVFAVIKQL